MVDADAEVLARNVAAAAVTGDIEAATEPAAAPTFAASTAAAAAVVTAGEAGCPTAAVVVVPQVSPSVRCLFSSAPKGFSPSSAGAGRTVPAVGSAAEASLAVAAVVAAVPAAWLIARVLSLQFFFCFVFLPPFLSFRSRWYLCVQLFDSTCMELQSRVQSSECGNELRYMSAQ